MHELEFLADLLIAFSVGGLAVYLLRPLKVPSLVGLLIGGALVGPHGFSLISQADDVEVLAEIGVVLLLFTIGLEFSLSQLVSMWRLVVGVGFVQVGLSIGVTTAVASAFGFPLPMSIFFGFLVALSSTAIVLRLLGDRAELSSPVGRVVLGVLLFQDLCIVPLMLLTPFLAGQESSLAELAGTLLKACGVVLGVIVAARYVVPFILFQVVKARSRELFLTLLVVLCLGTAWLTSLSGLSLALGAFLAGLAVSESEYSHQAMAEAIPFRDAFGSLFFLSIGMLMDAGFVVANALLVLAMVGGLVVLKALTAGLAAAVFGFPMRVAVHTGFALAQIGEFAFVLAHPGLDLGLLSQTAYQVFLSASVLSMLLSPLLLGVGRRVGEKLSDRTRLVPWQTRYESLAPRTQSPTDHVIIVGYGLNGKNLARTLKASHIAYVTLELNPETVRRARSEGEPISYGDSTSPEILRSVGISEARMLVVAISDAASTRRTVAAARAASAGLRILVRTRFVSEVEELRRIGADEVIPEEFETSLEIFSRVLERYSVPRNTILQHVAAVREGSYEVLRSATQPSPSGSLEPLDLRDVGVETLRVNAQSETEGKTLAELNLRKRTGASVIAIRRGPETVSNPDAEFRLQNGDVAVLIGRREQLDQALLLFDAHTD